MKRIFSLILVALVLSSTLFAFTSSDLEGKWYLACKTPVGIKKGYLDCRFEDESKFGGVLNLFNKDNEIINGVLEGNQFSFEGSIQFFGKIPYTAKGNVIDDSFVKAVVDSSMGKFVAVAYRDEARLKEAKNVLKQMEKEL